MNTTLTAADKSIVSASISATRLKGRWYDARDIRVSVEITALKNMALEKPLDFCMNVRLGNRWDDGSFEQDYLYAADGSDYDYDDDADAMRYSYSDGSSILVPDGLNHEVVKMMQDFIWDAVDEAQRAYEAARDKALGL